MTRAVFLLVWLTLAAFAADLNGTWTGSAKGMEERDHGAILHLKQNGTEITGTAGPTEEMQWTILNGKIDGDHVTFDLNADGPIVKFDLTLEDAHLKGAAVFEMDGQPKKVTLDLTRRQE
jgi:hypothetical protein